MSEPGWSQSLPGFRAHVFRRETSHRAIRRRLGGSPQASRSCITVGGTRRHRSISQSPATPYGPSASGPPTARRIVSAQRSGRSTTGFPPVSSEQVEPVTQQGRARANAPVTPHPSSQTRSAAPKWYFALIAGVRSIASQRRREWCGCRSRRLLPLILQLVLQADQSRQPTESVVLADQTVGIRRIRDGLR